MTTLRKIKNKTVPSLNMHKVKSSAGSIIVSVFRYVLLGAVSYIVLYPLFAMISLSLLSEKDIYDTSVTWIAANPTFDNYVTSFEALNYPSGLLQTILVGGISAFLEIFSCAIAAYGFSRFEFKERNLLFGLVLLTAIVPVQILVLPLFINYKYFDFVGILDLISGGEWYIDFINTPFTFWLPSLFGVGLRSGLFIFIYRQFFMGLPKELEEASWIDGCGPLKTFFRIVIPSSGVVFLTVTIFAIIWHWNEYYQSVIFFSDNFPLSVQLSNLEPVLHNFAKRDAAAVPYISAACLMFIAPMLTMFLILQKKFIQSIDRVGIVG